MVDALTHGSSKCACCLRWLLCRLASEVYPQYLGEKLDPMVFRMSMAKWRWRKSWVAAIITTEKALFVLRVRKPA